MGLRIAAALLLAAGLLLVAWDRGPHPGLIDRRAPDFTLHSDGHSLELKQFEGRKVVVLNFWASWCPPCVDEIPSLGAMQSRLSDQVQVVAVSWDEDPQAYARFLQQYGVHFLTVRDPARRVNLLYGTEKIPDSYIIDRSGVVRRKFVGPVDWTSPGIIAYLRGVK